MRYENKYVCEKQDKLESVRERERETRRGTRVFFRITFMCVKSSFTCYIILHFLIIILQNLMI